MATNLKAVHEDLESLSDPDDVKNLQRFFKTGPGEYGEGDQFRGIRVPVTRKLAQKFKDLSITDIEELLQSKFHEDRLLALFLLIQHFQKGDPNSQKLIYDLYLKNIRFINNWDLVDSSAEHILGAWLSDKCKDLLFDFTHSDSLWKRRIAIMSTFHYIKKGEFDISLRIAEILRNDPEDLIQKAVGWMLREIGKRDLATEETFLKKYYKELPRTMLRYAIEKFPEEKRQKYLNS
ncbi:MAG TPA: DNA alkylation repair protein [Balneolales bacterium]|nr:DNA alkylation repair protein [Balneolales bacterium]